MVEYQHIIEFFEQLPVLIQIVWMLSGLLLLILLTLIIYLKYLRSHLRKNEKIVSDYEKEYESKLIAYLYSGDEKERVSEEQQGIQDQLKHCVKDKFKRNIVISILLRLKSEISGEMAQSIQKLYHNTGLLNYTASKLSSKNWYVIAKGIKELSQFEVKEVYNDVVKHLNHKRREVRKEVHLYLINIFHFKGLEFLNKTNLSLTEWDQIQILGRLHRLEEQELPDIRPWLKSGNDDVVGFSLKLAKIYNQFEAKDTLLDLLDHPNKKIRVQVISVLSHLNIFKTKEVLKDTFNERSKDEQIAFFQLLENMFDNSDESFILDHIHHKNFEIKFLALKILKILSVDKFKNLELTSLEPEFVKIVNFLESN